MEASLRKKRDSIKVDMTEYLLCCGGGGGRNHGGGPGGKPCGC